LGERHKPLHPPAIVGLTHRVIEPHGLDVERAQRADRIASEPGGLYQLIRGRCPAQLLGE
jgi:hypothetical protein